MAVNNIVEFKKKSVRYFPENRIDRHDSLTEIVSIGAKLMMIASELTNEMECLMAENISLKEELSKFQKQAGGLHV